MIYRKYIFIFLFLDFENITRGAQQSLKGKYETGKYIQIS